MKIPSIIIEMIIISLLITVAIVLSNQFQNQISFQDGKGWDGVEYSKMAEQITANQKISARAPFVYRVGTSFLVAKFFPGNLNFGFKLLNICAGVIGAYLLWFWLTLYIDNKIVRILLAASYVFYWQTPLRLSFYYPYHSDPLALVFLFSGLILIKYLNDKFSLKKLIVFTAITFIGVFFREICLIPALVLFLAKSSDKYINYSDSLSSKIIKGKKISLIFFFNEKFRKGISITRFFDLNKNLFLKNVYFLPLFLGITGIIITHFLVSQDNNYSFFNSAIYWIYSKSLFKYIHAYFLSIGTIFIVIIYYFSENLIFLKKNKLLLIYLLIIIFISIAGGSDTERMIMWSIPVIYILIGNTIIKHKYIFKSPFIFIFIIITQIISIRAFLLIPDYPDSSKFQFPLLTPISNHFPLFNLWTIHGDEKILLISFAEYVTLALFLSYYIWGKSKKQKTL